MKRATSNRDEDEVQAFIAKRGVTKCPPAAAAPTEARIPKAAGKAIAKHDAEQERAYLDSLPVAAGGKGVRSGQKPPTPVPTGHEPAPAPAPATKKAGASLSRGTPEFLPGPKPEMRWLPIDQLVIDHEYQRPLSKEHAAKLRREFKWAHFQPLTVTRLEDADEDELYAVIDGQHRLESVRPIREIAAVPCYVVAAADLQQQASAFLAINTNHRYVTPLDRHRAGLAAHDETALEIQRILGEAGVELISPGARKPLATASVYTLRIGLKRCGADALKRALKLLAKAWPEDPDGFSEAFVSAMPRIVRDHGAVLKDATIVGVLGALKPREFFAAQLTVAREQRMTGSAMVLQTLTERCLKAAKAGSR